MERSIPQNRRLGRGQPKGKRSQNLQDMSNFGNIDPKLYEISYFPYISLAIDAPISLLFSVKREQIPVSPRMARIVHSTNRGSGGRCTVLADRLSKIASKYT